MQRKPYGNPFANAFRVLCSSRPHRAILELVRIRLDRGMLGSWALFIYFGRSAGYRCGATAYVAHKGRFRGANGCGFDTRSGFGVARKANRVPFLMH